ncbi:MAG: hypothetical protein CYG60_02590 [Actinobacteria bacterium]|nr:MAG: hypothetical protein CYG60_02590 [Actinomycetota bacterium]
MLVMSGHKSRKKYERDYYVRADAVRRLRNRAHMTLDELQQASGVNYTTINRIERGHNKSPQWKTLKPLAKALGVAVDELVVYTEDLPLEGEHAEDEANPAVTPENREQARKFVEEIDAGEKARGDGRDGAGNP